MNVCRLTGYDGQWVFLGANFFIVRFTEMFSELKKKLKINKFSTLTTFFNIREPRLAFVVLQKSKPHFSRVAHSLCLRITRRIAFLLMPKLLPLLSQLSFVFTTFLHLGVNIECFCIFFFIVIFFFSFLISAPSSAIQYRKYERLRSQCSWVSTQMWDDRHYMSIDCWRVTESSLLH